MPVWWNDSARWQKGLAESSQVLQRFDAVLAGLQAECDRHCDRNRSYKSLGQWLVDVAALIFAMVHALVLWGWVLPAGVKKGKVCNAEAAGSSKDMGWVNSLRMASSKGDLPSTIMTRIHRILKPVSLQPPAQICDQGLLLSRAESHNLWCQQVKEQSQWQEDFDRSHDREVNRRVAQLHGSARAHTGDGLLDAPITRTSNLESSIL